MLKIPSSHKYAPIPIIICIGFADVSGVAGGSSLFTALLKLGAGSVISGFSIYPTSSVIYSILPALAGSFCNVPNRESGRENDTGQSSLNSTAAQSA